MDTFSKTLIQAGKWSTKMPEVFYGGPYINESAAIEAELLRAKNADEEPDLWGLFNGKPISDGAVKLIKTHLEGHPNKGYEGERAHETVEAHGNPNVEKPFAEYEFPTERAPHTDGLASIITAQSEEVTS